MSAPGRKKRRRRYGKVGGGGISWSSYWATLISATVENAAPTNVVLTFPSEGTSVATDITATVNGAARVVSLASWTGGVWTVVLASAVADGDIIIVTFAPSGGAATVENNVYTLYDDFITDDSAPVTSPRTCEPGPGVLTITDTTNKVSIASNIVTLSGYGSQLADPKIVGPTRTNQVGDLLYLKFTGNIRIGYQRTGLTAINGGLLTISNGMYPYNYGNTINVSQAIQAGVTYELAIIKADVGCITAIKGGIYTDWTLIYLANAFANIYDWYSSSLYVDVYTSGTISDMYEIKLGGLWGKTNLYSNVYKRAAVTNGETFTAESANMFMQFSWIPATGETLDILFRRQDDDNCWILRCVQAGGGTGTLTLFEKVLGTETQRAQKTGVDTSAGAVTNYFIKCQGNIIIFGQTALGNSYTSATFNTQTGIKINISSTGIVQKFIAYPTQFPASFIPLTMTRGELSKNIFLLGDSKTQAATFENTLAYNIEDANDFGCYCSRPNKYGLPGASVEGIQNVIDAQLATRLHRADYALINLGANNIETVDFAPFESDYLYIIDALTTKWPSVQIYLALVWVRNYEAACDVINTHIANVIAQRTNVHQGFDERIWLEGGDDGATMTTDGIHYSVAGNIEAANQWKTVLGL